MAIQSRWEPPTGLERPAPRPVRLSAQGKVLTFLSVVFLAAGAAFGVTITRQIRRDTEKAELLQAKGADAQGTVTNTWLSGGKSKTAMVAYRFTVDGRQVTGESSMERPAWVELNAGGTLPVRYLPGNPEVNRPAQGALAPMPGWLPWPTTLFFALPLFMFQWMIRRETRLLAEGTPVAGVVTQVYRRKKLIVCYDFKLPTGEAMRGKSAMGRVGAAPQPGEQVCILYNPDHPRRNAVYPLETVKLGDA